MTTTCDIKHSIGGIINEYIKPKTPIYEVHYIVSLVHFGDLQTISKNHLAELSQNDTDLFTNNRPTISTGVVETWNQIIKNGFIPAFTIADVETDIYPYDGGDTEIIINIYKLKRVA